MSTAHASIFTIDLRATRDLQSTMVLRELAIMASKATEEDDFLDYTYARGRRRTRKSLSMPKLRRIRDVLTSDDDAEAVSELSFPESWPHCESAALIALFIDSLSTPRTTTTRPRPQASATPSTFFPRTQRRA